MAKALTSKNKKGIFDVLPLHANFISLVEEKLIVHKENGETQDILVRNGVLRVRENKIEIYLDVKEKS